MIDIKRARQTDCLARHSEQTRKTIDILPKRLNAIFASPSVAASSEACCFAIIVRQVVAAAHAARARVIENEEMAVTALFDQSCARASSSSEAWYLHDRSIAQKLRHPLLLPYCDCHQTKLEGRAKLARHRARVYMRAYYQK